MSKIKTINVNLESICVFLPTKASIFEEKHSHIKFFEYHSYIRSYALSFMYNGKYYQTTRIYDEDLYANLVSYLKKHDPVLTIEVKETSNEHILELIQVNFPENFKLSQYTKVVNFIPLALRTKRCSKETYDESICGRNLDDTPIYSVYDPKYQGDATHSLTVIVDDKQYITKFSDLTYSESQKIISAIHSFSTLKGTFRFTQRTATLINIA